MKPPLYNSTAQQYTRYRVPIDPRPFFCIPHGSRDHTCRFQSIGGAPEHMLSMARSLKQQKCSSLKLLAATIHSTVVPVVIKGCRYLYPETYRFKPIGVRPIERCQAPSAAAFCAAIFTVGNFLGEREVVRRRACFSSSSAATNAGGSYLLFYAPCSCGRKV